MAAFRDQPLPILFPARNPGRRIACGIEYIFFEYRTGGKQPGRPVPVAAHERLWGHDRTHTPQQSPVKMSGGNDGTYLYGVVSDNRSLSTNGYAVSRSSAGISAGGSFYMNLRLRKRTAQHHPVPQIWPPKCSTVTLFRLSGHPERCMPRNKKSL